MILVYYNPRSNRSTTNFQKPIGLTSSPPIFSLDLRLHSQYIHRYLHQTKDKLKHQMKRTLDYRLDLLNQTNLMLNFRNSSGSDRNLILKRKSRDLNLDDQKASELLTSAQFVSSSYNGRLTFNFSASREQFILKLQRLKEEDAGEYVCRTDFKWTRTLISVVNLFVIGMYIHNFIYYSILSM